MKKRFAIISLILVYFTTTTGFALNLHFCGSKIVTIRLNSPVKPCCKKEFKLKKSSCCKDRHIKVKISDQQQKAAETKIPSVPACPAFSIFYAELIPVQTAKSEAESISYRGPPVFSSVPVTVKNCAFRI